MKIRLSALCSLIVLLAGCAGGRAPMPATSPKHASSAYTTADIKRPPMLRNGGAGLQVPGVSQSMLQPEFWIARTKGAEDVLHSAQDVAALNTRTWAQSRSLYSLDTLPATFKGDEVGAWISALAESAKPQLMDMHAQVLGGARVAAMRLNANVAAVPEQLNVRWATVVSRANLRAVPSPVRAYRKTEDISINIDRLQESAVFPGWAVAVLHSSADGQWVFVNAYNYRAWMRADALRFVERSDALARNAAVQPKALPYSRANLIRTAFAYLGEPYGWGHADGTRDCSGFVSEVYAALGVVMPRNTGDQRDMQNFYAARFSNASSHDERGRAVAAALPGDLVFIPGHVMMVLGQMDGQTFVIHDTPGVRFPGGVEFPLYGVSVTALEPLMADGAATYLDKIQAIVRPFE